MPFLELTMTRINYLFALIIILLSAASNGQKMQAKHKPLFPLAVGNYWIYTDSKHPDKPDTVRITMERMIGTDTAFTDNHGMTLTEKNDSVFTYDETELQARYKELLYFPAQKETQFSRLVGGDLLFSVTACRIDGPYKVNGKEYFDCYKFTTPHYDEKYVVIISRGIGIIETEESGIKRSLKEYKVE